MGSTSALKDNCYLSEIKIHSKLMLVTNSLGYMVYFNTDEDDGGDDDGEQGTQ